MSDRDDATIPERDARLVADLRVAIGRLVRSVRADDGMPAGRLAVLGALDREGPATTSDLAALMRVRPQSMARTVALAVEAGLVDARPHPTDRRKALNDLTSEGRAAMQHERRRREGWMARAIAAELSAEERATLRAAVPLLERLADRV